MREARSIMKIAVVLAIAASLAGCAEANRKVMSADVSEVGRYPIDYKVVTRDYLHKTLVDPYSVRDAQISKPKMGKLFVEGTLGVQEPGWLVCFRSNAKNRMGAYTGISDMAIVIRGGVVRASLSDPSHSHYIVKMICDNETYEPFSEMEQARQQQGR